jgi:4-amino-4-deoxy-L-arabinose transferase-like glycosyltransferase
VRRSLSIAAGVAALLAASNLVVSSLLGLGDSEALYACYGRHLQLSYLDHPPLVGWLIGLATEAFGGSVLAVRLVPLAMTPLALLFSFLLARDLFGERAAGWSSLLLLATPMFAVGLVAATPDAPLAALWSLFVWQLGRALADRDPRGVWSRFGRPALLGAVLGLAFLSKYTGACLAVTAVIALAGRQGRAWLGRPGTWIGAAIAAAAAAPVLIWNAEHDWAGVAHRLVWTQEGAGFSFRNAGALIGGQLLYAGPLTLVLFCWAGIWIWRRRRERSQPSLLLAASVPTLAATYLLVLWSDVAEPHWPAPGYLPLAVAAAGLVDQSTGWPRRLARCAVGLGLVILLAAQVLVLSPLLPRLLGDAYRPEHDLANELRGWPDVAGAIRALNRDRRPVLAAFYTQCSQLEFALGEPGDPPVRCASPEVDDFDVWYGDFRLGPEGALFVTDNRFEHDPEQLVPGSRVRGPPLVIEIERGGRWVRRFYLYRLE